MTRGPWAVFVVASLTAVSSNAHADGPASAEISSDARALAETLFFTARGMMEAGKYSAACPKFAESYRLDPAAGTLINMAVCHEKEGKNATAWGEFRQALADARKVGNQAREQLADEHIKTLEPELPFLTIHVPDAVKVRGLEVVRNGTTMTPPTWDVDLPVDPGTVEVIERAPLYKPKTKHIDIANKQHLTLELEPLELAPVYIPPPPFWTTRREIGATLIGVGAAGIIAGAVTGELAISGVSSSNQNCPIFEGERRCTTTGANDMSNAKTFALVSDIGFGVGAAGIISGVILMALKTQEASPSPAPTAWSDPRSWFWTVSATPRATEGFVGHSF